MISLSNVPYFNSLPKSVAANDAAWHAWFDADEPEAIVAPEFSSTVMTSSQRLCLVKVSFFKLY